MRIRAFPEWRDQVREFARENGGTVSVSGERLRIAAGTLLATHPARIRWSAEVGEEGDWLTVEVRPRVLPRATRIARQRTAQLASFLGGPEAAKVEDPGVGSPRWFASMTAQTAAAIAGAFVVVLPVALWLISGVIDELSVRAGTLCELGELSLPSASELASPPHFQAALLLALPIAFLVGAWCGFLHAIGELWRPAGRAIAPGIVAVAVWVAMGLSQVVHPAIALATGAAAALAAQAALSLVWNLRAEGGASTRWGWAVAALALLAMPWPGTLRERMGEFRDVWLLSNPPGAALARAYYRSTLYVTEAYKPLYSDPFSGGPRDPGFLRTALTTRDGLPFEELGVVARVVPRPEYEELARQGGYDLYLPEPPPGMSARELSAALLPQNREAFWLRRLLGTSLLALVFAGPALIVFALAGALWFRPWASLIGPSVFLVLVALVGRPPPLADARDALVRGSLRERMRAPLALARASDRDAIPLMIERLRADPDPLVRYRIAAAFRGMPAPEAAEALRATVREDRWYAGMHAIAALRRLARP